MNSKLGFRLGFINLFYFIYLEQIKRNIRVTDGERGDKIKAIVNGNMFYIII